MTLDPAEPSGDGALRPARRLDYRRGYRRLLYSHLAWPMLAVLLIGGVGTLLVRPGLTGAWSVLIALALVGGFLPLAPAIMLGGAAFITAVPFLLVQQSEVQLGGDLFLLMALFPFAPVWLAAARAQQVRATRLHMLLSLPQVRAATDVSEWSLLPRPRAIDRRLRGLEKSGEQVPAIMIRIRFTRLAAAYDLLGEAQLQQSVLSLADDLRLLLRAGDVLAEDLRAEGALYVLAFHNPDEQGSLTAILRRLAPALGRTGLEHVLTYALYPESGRRLHEMRWQLIELPS